jgi:tetratricopeptide (TPR) repeat protein
MNYHEVYHRRRSSRLILIMLAIMLTISLAQNAFPNAALAQEGSELATTARIERRSSRQKRATTDGDMPRERKHRRAKNAYGESVDTHGDGSERRRRKRLSEEDGVQLSRVRQKQKKPSTDLNFTRGLIGAGELRRGASLSRKMLRFEPNNPAWNELYTRFRIHSGHLDERMEACAERAVTLAPQDCSVITTFAMLKFFEKQFPVAINLAKAALKLKADNVTAKAIIAASQSNIDYPPTNNLSGPLLRRDDDDTTGGFGSSSKSAGEASSDPPSLTKTVADVSKDSDNMIKIAEGAGSNHDAYLVLGAHFRMHLNKARLLQVLNAWVKNNPKAAYPYLMRGLFEEDFKRIDRAAADYRKALELNPLCVQAMNRYAYTLGEEKKYKECVETYDLVEQLNGMFPASYGHRGNALEQLKDYTNAALDYGRAVNFYIGETVPSKQLDAAKKLSKSRQASIRMWWSRRAEVYYKAKKYQRAIDDARLLLMFSPGYNRGLDIRQRSYQALKQYDLALKDLNGMISMSPNIAPWYKTRAEVLTKLGRTKEAAEDMKRYESVVYKGTPQ